MKHTGVLLSLALLAACCLASCIHTDDTLGSALVPSSQDITIQTATLDLPLRGMRASDDLQSRLTGSVTVGNIGTDFYSEGLMTITASTDSIVWGKNPTVQRVYLSMVRDTALVMRDDQLYIPQNIYVHRLNFELDSTHVNATHDRFKGQYYDPEPISTGGFVYTGDDAWSVELKKEIGEELLRFPMATLDSAQLFMKQFYGICLRGDYPESSLTAPDGEGRLNLFDLSSSYLIINWDYDDDAGVRKRATAYFSLGAYHVLNLYRTLRTTSASADQLVVQGLSGSKPYVSARALKESVEDWAAGNGISPEDIVIAKASVEFPFEYSGQSTQLDHYAASLYPCQRVVDDNGIAYYSPLAEINDTSLEGGSIDRSQLYYKSNISLYLQDLLSQEDSDIDDEDDLWFMPTYSYYNSNTGTTYYYADNYFYTQTTLNGTSALRHPVLKLTYSVLK